MRKINEPQPGVRGWLLLLCVLLIVWGPAETALVAASALGALSIRGLPLACILVAQIGVAGLGIAAGLALLNRHGAAVQMARAALIASALLDTFVYLTPYVPNNRMPGDDVYYVAGSLIYCGLWLGYLQRSRRVTVTFA